MALNPFLNPQAEDFVTIAGVSSPGVIPPGGISGAKRTYKYDVKTGKGTAGSTTTFVGKPPSPFTIKFVFWEEAQFDAWIAFLPLLKYDPTKKGKAAQAYDVFHPVLAELDIKSVVTTDIAGREHDGAGLYTVAVEFLEYAQASKASVVSTPKGSKSAPAERTGTTVAGEPPGEKPDDELKKLQKEADALAKQGQEAA